MEKDNRFNHLFSQLADAASNAADDVSDAMHSASQAVGERYDSVKLTIEITRLYDEQKKLFTNIGHTLYLIQAGMISRAEDKPNHADMMGAQQTIGRLLLLADQKQQEIDLASQRLQQLTGEIVCGTCNKTVSNKDVYCSSCGAKLNPTS